MTFEKTDIEEIVLAVLRRAAKEGRRCPTNPEIRRAVRDATDGERGIALDCMPSELAYRGLCRTEVYGRNYRVVEIDGMRSKEPPRGGEPYLIITRGKRHEVGAP